MFKCVLLKVPLLNIKIYRTFREMTLCVCGGGGAEHYSVMRTQVSILYKILMILSKNICTKLNTFYNVSEQNPLGFLSQNRLTDFNRPRPVRQSHILLYRQCMQTLPSPTPYLTELQPLFNCIHMEGNRVQKSKLVTL